MNNILSKDGILAFIGTKSEFGLHKTELKDRTETDSTRSWTSLPESTLLATLGLLVNTSTVEGRSLVFHGSPRVLGLWYMIVMYESNLAKAVEDRLASILVRKGKFHLSAEMQKQMGFATCIDLSNNEAQDLWNDYFCGYLANKLGSADAVADYIG
jgi:hypothetical protein